MTNCKKIYKNRRVTDARVFIQSKLTFKKEKSYVQENSSCEFISHRFN
jgi:hypothetical protein